MTTSPLRRRGLVAAILLTVAMATGCSSTAGPQTAPGTTPTATTMTDSTTTTMTDPTATTETGPTGGATSLATTGTSAAGPPSTSPSSSTSPTPPAPTSPGSDVPAPSYAWPLRSDGAPSAGDAVLTLQGGATWSADGASFDGTGGAVTTGPVDLDPGRDLTVTAWVRAEPGIGAFATAVSHLGEVAGSFGLGRGGNAWSFYLKENDANGSEAVTNGAAAGPEKITAAHWVHLAGVWDTALRTVTLYVNGVKAADTVSGPPFAAHGPIAIGRGQAQGKPDDFWRGTIADVRIFPAALDIDQVGAVAHDEPPAGADFAPPPPTAPCAFPEGGACLGELTAGEHFTRAMTPEFGYTVPDGWTNAQDLPGQYVLTTTGSDPTADYVGVYQRVSGAAQDCSDGVDPKAGTTPEAFASWLRGLPGVTVDGPHQTSVGGLPALMLDLRPKPGTTAWPCVDGDVQVIPILIGGPGDTQFFNHAIGVTASAGDTFGMRLYLFTWAGVLAAIEVSTIGDAKHQAAFAKAAEPIIASIRFASS